MTTKLYEVLKVGEQRRVNVHLWPGSYDVERDHCYRLLVEVTVDRIEECFMANAGRPDQYLSWRVLRHEWSTAVEVVPPLTTWQRLKKWLIEPIEAPPKAKMPKAQTVKRK